VNALDRLASLAVLLAVMPIAWLGIGHPVTQLLVVSVVCGFGWLLASRPVPRGGSEGGFQGFGMVVAALDLRWPDATWAWLWIGVAGVATGILRWLLDRQLLGGLGGLEFYDRVLRQYGVIGADGVRWSMLVVCGPIVLLVILIDGVFFSGLIQRRIAAHSNGHVGVQAQALLFALPHTFAGPSPDLPYGVGTFVAGVAYGYLYRAFHNHWIPASLLWLHVVTVWVIMLCGV
jgi:membrane protease YdiL (CAAX protease family)